MSPKPTFILTLSLLLSATFIWGAQVVGGPTKAEDETHAFFSTLIGKIFTDDDDTKVTLIPASSEMLSQLDASIDQVVNTTLSKSLSRDTDVSAQISSLRGMKLNPTFTNAPSAYIFSLNGIKTVALSYIIPEGAANWMVPITHNRLKFYTAVLGKWTLSAQAPVDDFHECTFFVDRINLKDQMNSWFLVHGSTIGDTGVRMKVRLFSYDGISVKTVWQKDALRQGGLELKDDVITLTFLRHFHSEDPADLLRVSFQLIGGQVHCISPICE